MSIDHGRSPSEPGYSAEPEPKEVSAVPVSIPNAMDLLCTELRAANLQTRFLTGSYAWRFANAALRACVAMRRRTTAEVVTFLRDEANMARYAQGNAAIGHPDKLYRMGQKDGLLLAASAIEAAIAGETTKIGSTEGESAVPEGQTPEPLSSTNPNTERQSL